MLSNYSYSPMQAVAYQEHSKPPPPFCQRPVSVGREALGRADRRLTLVPQAREMTVAATVDTIRARWIDFSYMLGEMGGRR